MKCMYETDRKVDENESEDRTIYCRACNRYGMPSQYEYNPICPDCGANAQWEDEVTLTLSIKESD